MTDTPTPRRAVSHPIDDLLGVNLSTSRAAARSDVRSDTASDQPSPPCPDGRPDYALTGRCDTPTSQRPVRPRPEELIPPDPVHHRARP